MLHWTANFIKLNDQAEKFIKLNFRMVNLNANMANVNGKSYINISSGIAILEVKKLECQKRAIPQILMLTNENILQNSKSILLGTCSACYASSLSTATKKSVLKSTGQRQSIRKNANNMYRLPAVVPSQLKETVQDQARPCLHVSRHTTRQVKKPSDCVTLCWPGVSGAIGDCLSRLCPSTCWGRNKPHSTNNSRQEGLPYHWQKWIWQ